MVMTSRALHDAYTRLTDGLVSPGIPAGMPQSGNVEQSFVPWVSGKNVTGADQWGFTWFTNAVSFAGINSSGLYLIENYLDAYLFIGGQPSGREVPPDTLRGVIIPPFTAGVYYLGRDTFTVTSMCAGYSFNAALRSYPGANANFLDARGITAHVHIVSLSSSDAPATQPQLRTGWVRRYDWFDLSAGGAAITVGPAGGAVRLPHGDFSGAKSITSYMLISSTGGDNAQIKVSLMAASVLDDAPPGYVLGSATGPGGAGAAKVTISASIITGVGPYLYIVNNDPTHNAVLSDGALEVTF